jgi:hypothetical protein
MDREQVEAMLEEEFGFRSDDLVDQLVHLKPGCPWAAESPAQFVGILRDEADYVAVLRGEQELFTLHASWLCAVAPPDPENEPVAYEFWLHGVAVLSVLTPDKSLARGVCYDFGYSSKDIGLGYEVRSISRREASLAGRPQRGFIAPRDAFSASVHY